MSTFNPENYVDVGQLLDAGDVSPASPTVGLRSDGVGLFYAGQLNTLFGNPESGKTLIAQCALADELSRGRAGLIIDLDHNGAPGTVSRLITMGADPEALRDPQRFRYCAPEDADQLAAIIAETKQWSPSIVIIDSIGELMPLYGASSNSPDDFTRVHSLSLKPLADSGAAVVAIDHLAKNPDSQNYGSTGTAAKKRVIGGTSLRVQVLDPFKPGGGGRAQLTINKDRHGGLRAASPSEEREPLAATFRLWEANGDLRWTFVPPVEGQRSATPDVSPADLRDLCELMPPANSQRDVKDRLGWGSQRALNALREWRRLGSPTTVLPAPETPMSGAEEHAPTDAPGAHLGAQEQPSTRFPGIDRGAVEEIPLLPAPPHRPSGAQEHPVEVVV